MSEVEAKAPSSDTESVEKRPQRRRSNRNETQDEKKKRRKARKARKSLKAKEREEEDLSSDEQNEQHRNRMKPRKSKKSKKSKVDDSSDDSVEKEPLLSQNNHHPSNSHTRTLSLWKKMNYTMTTSMASALNTTHLSSALKMGLRLLPRPSSSTNNVSFGEDYQTELNIYCTDQVPNDPYVMRPIVKVHVVDKTTGEYIKKLKKKGANSNKHVAPLSTLAASMQGKVSIFLHFYHFLPILVGAFVWNEELLIQDVYSNLADADTVLLFEIVDIGPRIPKNRLVRISR